MQCPSCGFENAPGLERCGICSTPLTAKREPTAVYPPRARERSISQKILWTLQNDPHWVTIRRTLDRIPIKRERVVGGLRNAGRLLASVVPGFGHLLFLKRPAIGAGMLITSGVAVALAVLCYQSFLADLLACWVIALSIASVSTTANRIWAAGQSAAARMRRLAIPLLVFAAYLGGYVFLRAALQSVVSLARMAGPMHMGIVLREDNLLLWNLGELRRGDVIVAEANYHGGSVASLGIIIGLPGEAVHYIGGFYIHGRPARVGLPIAEPPAYIQGSARQLQPDEYWVWLEGGGPRRSWTVVVRRRDIRGRAVAIIGPPGHRRSIAPVRIEIR